MGHTPHACGYFRLTAYSVAGEDPLDRRLVARDPRQRLAVLDPGKAIPCAQVMQDTGQVGCRGLGAGLGEEHRDVV